MQRKIEEDNTEWERLEISLRKLDTKRIFHAKDGHNKGQKQYGPNQSRRY